LNWGIVRKNWPKYRKGFYDFKIDRLARVQSKELMKQPNAIRNFKKIKGIICNAKEFQKIKKKYGSFSNLLKLLKQIEDGKVSKFLMKRFRHVGEYTAEYYLHCVGYRKESVN